LIFISLHLFNNGIVLISSNFVIFIENFYMKNVNVILKGRKNENYGYIKISIRHLGKTKVYSIGLKVKKKDFNPVSQRVRTSCKDYERLNEEIEEKVTFYKYLPHQRIHGLSICQYIDIISKNTVVQGTRQKYENIKSLFEKFLKETYNRDDIHFEEFDSIVVGSFYKWLRTNGNKQNTTNYLMKGFKSFFSKIEKDGKFKYPVDPFGSMTFSYEDVDRNFLTVDELKKFYTFTPNEFRTKRPSQIKLSLTDIKEGFLFSLFGQGLRISDIMTLRFNDFEILSDHSIIIRKKMIKTKKNVIVYLNSEIFQLLENQIMRTIKESSKEEIKLFLPDFKQLIERREYLLNIIKEGEKVELWDKILHINGEISMDEDLFNTEKCIKELVETNMKIYELTFNLIQLFSTDPEIKVLFVFPFLFDFLFTDIDEGNDFSILSEEQYLHFHGRRSYINKLLKDLFKQCEITKKLSFHSSRHTYTTLLLCQEKIDFTLVDVQQSLGHVDITSTQKYIRPFFTKKVKGINQSLIQETMKNTGK